MEPRSSADSRNVLPDTSAVTAGGDSSPSKSRRSSVERPGSVPMYAPASSVPNPETRPPEMRGRTTQNLVSLTIVPLETSFTISAVTITPLRSSSIVICFTVPMSTSLYLMRVLPASRPSAVRKRIVIVGPRSRKWCRASHPAMSAATIGMIHTGCTQRMPGWRATARGRSESGVGSVISSRRGDPR